MKVSRLQGADLNRWVAKAQGWSIDDPEEYCPWWINSEEQITTKYSVDGYTPSTDKAQAMELLIKYEMGLRRLELCDDWHAAVGRRWRHDRFGPTAMVAICRAVVASMYGEEVDDNE